MEIRQSSPLQKAHSKKKLQDLYDNKSTFQAEFALAMGLVDSFETTKVNGLGQEQQTMENWQLAVQAFCKHYGYAALIAILLCLCH
jgi:hypothetical protein